MTETSRGRSPVEAGVDAGGVPLHVRRFEGAGPPLLLLHGLGVSGAVWHALARRLTPSWSPVAPDLRGHGASGKPEAGYAPGDLARDLDALLAALDIARAPVVGHSLGALAALALAAEHPERVAALVLLDPPLDPQLSNPDVPVVYRLRHAPPGELERYLAGETTGAAQPPAVVRALAALFRQAADGPYREYLAAPRGAPWAYAAAPAVAAPTLVVQADPEAGGVLGDAAAARFAGALQAGRVLKIAGAPHALHATHGPAVAAAVLDFLRDTTAGPAGGQPAP